MAEPCSALASRLNANFLFGNATFDPQILSLPQYLNDNGVLLSMCGVAPPQKNTSGGPCSVASSSNHLSASYIHSTIGRHRFIPMPVGILLDPLLVDITCVYPTDAATDARDGNGCGPPTIHPKYGSKGSRRAGFIGRWLERRNIEQYTRQHFGDRRWQDIPCKEFFALSDSLDNGTVWREEDDVLDVVLQDELLSSSKVRRQILNNSSQYVGTQKIRSDGNGDSLQQLCSKVKKRELDYKYEPLASWISWELGSFLHHPPCETQHPEPSFTKYNWFEYGGTCSWEPNEFQIMMDFMKEQFLESRPEMFIWNEIVAAKPTSDIDEQRSIEGVFYVNYPGKSQDQLDSARELAKKEAKRLGDKPVLTMNWDSQTNEEPIFMCD